MFGTENSWEIKNNRNTNNAPPPPWEWHSKDQDVKNVKTAEDDATLHACDPSIQKNQESRWFKVSLDDIGHLLWRLSKSGY